MMLALVLFGCTEIALNPDLDRPEVAFILPVLDGTFNPEHPVDVCLAIDTERDLDTLDLVLASDVGGTLAIDGFNECEGGDLGLSLELEDAEHVLSITVSTSSGLSASDTVRITPIDNTSPRCEILFPSDNSAYAPGEPVDLQLRVEDDESSDVHVSIDSSQQGTLIDVLEPVDTNPSYLLALDEGSHDLVVLVEDGRGANDICLVSVDVLACTDNDNDGFETCDGDCDDVDAAIFPGADELLDGRDNDCDGTTDEGTGIFDDDGDGVSEYDGDCDDTDASIVPGATDVPDDGIDQDCSGADSITCFVDQDADGFGGTTTTVAPDGFCDMSDGESDLDTDCDDQSGTVYPGAPELVADGIDQDCDGVDSLDCFQDLDNDGWGSDLTVPSSDGDCDDPGEADRNGDCADDDDERNPTITDTLDDGIDQDCNGFDSVTCFEDGDRDGFGSMVTLVAADGSCDLADQESTASDDCDDNDAARFPGGTELQDDDVDQDCNGFDTVTCFVDADGDGFGANLTLAEDGSCDPEENEAEVSGDCADNNADRFPGNTEVPDDGVDQNCSGDDTLTCYTDVDQDGFGTGLAQLIEATCGSLALVDGDCDDLEPDAFPGNPEVSDDGIDQDCSGEDSITCFTDADGDSWGGTSLIVPDGACGPNQTERGGDCADNNEDRFPGNAEIPDDGIDQDCSGDDTVHCYTDADSDTYGVGSPQSREGSCGVLASRAGDCDDTQSQSYPGNTEVPGDGIDQDCSGTDTVACFLDADGDSYGGSPLFADDGSCDAAQGEVDVGGDCADDNEDRFPGNPEVLDDGIDQDCDNVDTVTCYTDADDDSYGVGSVIPTSATCGTGLANRVGDCDDTEPEAFPGNPEVVDDGIDQDCSGTDAITCFADDDDDGFGSTDSVTSVVGVCGSFQTTNDDDCDDMNANINPGETEVPYNSIDEDCLGGDLDDVDGDGVAGPSNTGPDCDDNDASVFPGGPEVFDGADNNCDGACDEGFILPGDVIVTEIMHQPDEASARNGEWFEMLNTTGSDITICGGWTFEDDGIDVAEFVDVTIPAGSYFVAASNGDQNANGGVPADYDYDWGTYKISDSDEITLVFNGMVIDHVGWNNDLGGNGYSSTLSVNHLNATDNDNTALWCESTTAWPTSDGDDGSPGVADPVCAL